MNSLSQPVYRADGKIVAQVSGQYLTKTVSASKHFLRFPPTIANDIAGLEEAEGLGATQVRVTDVESGKVYCASLNQIWTKGREFDRGHGPQQMLPLRYWNIEGDNEQLSLV